MDRTIGSGDCGTGGDGVELEEGTLNIFRPTGRRSSKPAGLERSGSGHSRRGAIAGLLI